MDRNDESGESESQSVLEPLNISLVSCQESLADGNDKRSESERERKCA